VVTRDSLKRYFVQRRSHFPVSDFEFPIIFPRRSTRLRQGYGVVEVEF